MKISFSHLTPYARAIWAKSGEGGGHGLLAHMLDVAAVAETLLALEPESTLHWAAARFGLPVEHLVRWIAAMAGLHDFGKAIPGFQARWPEGMQADEACGLEFPASACHVTVHACATAALLESELQALTDADVGWLKPVIQAVSAHHGYHFIPVEVNAAKPKGEPAQWASARREILAVYWQVLAPQGGPSFDTLTLPAVNWLAGLTSTVDWIASNPQWFPVGERCDELSTYYENARGLAAEALRRIGWSRARTLLSTPMETDALLTRIVGREVAARPLQQAGDRLLREVQGPALLLVEAPMGEGKTELAFLAHLRLQAVNRHRGLYVALPTQATGNALFKRALTFLENFTDGNTDVQLVHGGAALNEEVLRLRGIDHSRDASLSASAWFSQRRRPLLSSYGVGTVDQALFAILNVKHHFVRLWGLGNRVVVLDEVHAYDTYTTGLIVVLLRWLKGMGSSVVLMSATLPQARRNELLRAWGASERQLPELTYPRLMLVDEAGIRGEHCEARPLAPIHLAGLGEALDEIADKAIELLVDGGCGALIVNTVDRAQQLHMSLRERLHDDTELFLFHARYPAEQRLEHERRVLELFGATGKRPHRALLIATQVAEQSLDIDFDFMLSDLAPVDLLLQRAGRLHRHARTRPARHVEARLWVAGLRRDRLPELKETAWGFIYDPYILGRTWALLGREEILHLPADIDRLVQAVYDIDTPLPDELEAAAQEFIEVESYGKYRARVNQERQASINIAIDAFAEPENAYARPPGNEDGDGIGLENRTRLGGESIALVPVEVVDDGWCVRTGETPFAPDRPLDDATARRLYNRQIKISQMAVVKHFKTHELPAAFAEHALLRNCRPLPLRAGRYENNGMKIRLDEELGLVYEPDADDSKEKS